MQTEEFRKLVRLANRITYGANRQMLQVAESLGYEGFIEWQLDFESLDDSDLEGLLAEFLPTLEMSVEELFEFVFEQQNFGAPARDLTIATLIRRTFSPRQLFERMVEFWSDHFSVPIGEPILATFKITEDRELIRRNALGRFEDLLQGDAKSPAMLYYLDNFNNTAQGPNENYARELMELHTLGVDGGFSEDDIKSVARVFTGWTIRAPGEFVFNPAAHNWETKQVLGRKVEPFGQSEGEFVLGLLAAHPSTAVHVATKLARRFFADDPGPDLVEQVASTFELSGGDIRATLRTLLLHPVVIETGAIKFKRPNEFLAGLARSMETELSEQSLTAVFEALSTAGQTPFGWPAPDGYPDRREHWQSTNGLLMRFNTATLWTDRLGERSQVLREAAAIRHPIEQIEFLTETLAPQGLDPINRRILWRYANQLRVEERAAAIAAMLAAGPDGQWR